MNKQFGDRIYSAPESAEPESDPDTQDSDDYWYAISTAADELASAIRKMQAGDPDKGMSLVELAVATLRSVGAIQP